jgi:hypothetical protein
MIKSRRMKPAAQVASMRANRNACRKLVGMPEEETTLVKPRRTREDNIKIYLREIG